MPRAAADYADARTMMVDGQLRPNRVGDPALLAALRRLPRERFLPEALAPLAYADENVPLGGGRVLLRPLTIARLIQLAAPRQGERALVVGAASGYGAALLAACGPAVTALEEDEALHGLSLCVLPAVAPGVTIVRGRLADGWQAGGPYDLIFVEGALEQVPAALIAQLRPRGGRLVAVRTAGGRIGQAVLAEPTQGGLSEQPAFDCSAPVLPGLQSAAGFVF
jgi:protein-L-isoaspartate(D-aspartate) O-methyltransferase